MKTFMWFFFLAPCLHLYSQESSTLSKLEATYKGYMTACYEGKGKKAFSYLDHNSRVYFELMLNDLWYADSNALEKLPLSEKHLILLIRQINSREKLISFNPHSFAIYVLDEIGPLGCYAMEGYTLGELKEENNKAFAKLRVRDFYADPEFEFTKENGYWKLSLIPFLKYEEEHMLALYKRANTSEKESFMFLIQEFSGQPIDPNIWKATKS